MRLSLQRQHRLGLLCTVEVGAVHPLRGEKLRLRSLHKGDIIRIGGDDAIGIELTRLLDHPEEALRHLLPIDDEGAAKDLVPAVLAIHLREAEELRIRERTPQLSCHPLEVVDLLIGESETLLAIVLPQILHRQEGSLLDLGIEESLVQRPVLPQQHPVVGHTRLSLEESLHPLNGVDADGVGDLGRIGTPRSDHLCARTDEGALEWSLDLRGSVEEPAEGLMILIGQGFGVLYGIDRTEVAEKRYHISVSLMYGSGYLTLGSAHQMMGERSSGKAHHKATKFFDFTAPSRTKKGSPP